MTKFACCVFDAAGHTNPLLALTSELCERGHHVLFVLASPMMVGAIKKSKAKFTEGPAEDEEEQRAKMERLERTRPGEL